MTRAFRISFNTDVSKFTIEIQGFAGMYWKQAKVTEFRGEKDEFRASQNFDTYQLARDYVKRIGLDQIYEDFTIAKPWSAKPGQQGFEPLRPLNKTGEHLGQTIWTVPYAPQGIGPKTKAA